MIYHFSSGDIENTTTICHILCSTDTPIMEPCRIRNVPDTRVGHACHVYFKEFVTYPHVVSISMLPCPCNMGHICRLNNTKPVQNLEYVYDLIKIPQKQKPSYCVFNLADLLLQLVCQVTDILPSQWHHLLSLSKVRTKTDFLPLVNETSLSKRKETYSAA